MISIAVLALNEERNLDATVTNIVEAARRSGNPSLDIIIVNDGSKDRTPEICRELEQRWPFVRSLHHDVNRGIGQNVQDALRVAREPKFLILPGDNDISQDLIAAMFRHADQADVVMMYFLNKEMRGRRRNTLSSIFNVIYMCTFNIFVQYITGPAIYPTEALRSFRLRSRRVSVPVELTVKSLRAGLTYGEIGGHMCRGLEASRSLSWRNLLEVVSTYLWLIWDVKIAGRKRFNREPRRIEMSP